LPDRAAARSSSLIGSKLPAVDRPTPHDPAQPHSRRHLELYLAVLQPGLYLVPINGHLVAPEIAYIVQDSEAKVFVGHERFADVCAAAAEEIGFPKDQRFAVGHVPGFRPYDHLKAGQPTTLPSDRTTRWQGITSATGLLAQACATARMAVGLPMASATCA